MKRPLDIGSSYFVEVFKIEEITLRKYSVGSSSASQSPVLIVPSIINKSYILDLLPGRSLVEYFVSQGLSVYMIDWGQTISRSRYLNLEKLVYDHLYELVDATKHDSQCQQVQIFGHCLGGTLGLMYAALWPRDVLNLHMVTAPVDFSRAGVLAAWAQQTPFNLKLFTEAYEKAPAWLLQIVFQLARPASWPFKLHKLALKIQDQEFVRLFLALEYWSWDVLDLTGNLYHNLIQDLYRRNGLLLGHLCFDDEPCSLLNVTCPIYSISVEDDHVVPLESVLKDQYVPHAKCYHQVLKGGHIGGILGSYAQKNHWNQWVNNLKQARKPEQCQNSI